MREVDNLLAREMTRKEFLVTVGTAFLSVFGVSAFLGVFTGSTIRSNGSGFGSGYFGR